METADALEAQGVANVAWAVAKLKAQHPGLVAIMPVIGEVAAARVGDMTAQNLANLFWAAATLKEDTSCCDDALLVLARCVPKRIGEFTSQGVANIMWSVALLSDRVPLLKDLMPMLAQSLVHQPIQLKQQELAAVIWSAGQAALEPALTDRLFRALSAPVSKVLYELNPQHCTMLCSGMALSGWRDPALMKHVAAAILRSPAWPKRDVVLGVPTIAWSFARLRLRHAGLLRLLAHRCSEHLRDMRDWSICAVAWAYRELGSGEFASFLGLVDAEIERRGITGERVQASQDGLQAWLHD